MAGSGGGQQQQGAKTRMKPRKRDCWLVLRRTKTLELGIEEILTSSPRTIWEYGKKKRRKGKGFSGGTAKRVDSDDVFFQLLQNSYVR